MNEERVTEDEALSVTNGTVPQNEAKETHESPETLEKVTEDSNDAEDEINWKIQYQHLEASLERFKTQAVGIRQALAEKLKLMEQRLAAMNWEPTEMEKRLQELEISCQEKDRFIRDLEEQLDEQKRLRQEDAKVVEEKAVRIKEWVTKKLQALEQQNQDLATDNEILQDQVDILRDRLQALPSLTAQEIYRTSLQECGLRRSSHSSTPPEIPQRPTAAALGSSNMTNNGTNNQEYENPDYADSNSDDSMEDIEQNDNDALYQEIDRNHESKYELKRTFPPQIKIERKVFQEAHHLDSLVSSSTGSQEPLNRLQRISQGQSRISRTSHASQTSRTSYNSVGTNGSSKAGAGSHNADLAGESAEGDISDAAVSLSLSFNSPRTPATPFLPQAPPTTPSGSLTDIYSDKHQFPGGSSQAFTFTPPLPYVKWDQASHIKYRNSSSGLPVNTPPDIGAHRPEYSSAISEPSSSHLSGHHHSDPLSKSLPSWSYPDRNKSLKLKPPVKSPTDPSLTIAEAFTHKDLYRDVTVPVYATLKGRAAQIRNAPFTEDSTSDSSDNEDSSVAIVKDLKKTGIESVQDGKSEAVVTISDPHGHKTTTTTPLKKHPLTPSSSGAMKRGVSSSSIGSETSSDYALPPDEMSCKSDSENSEPELKLLKYTTDSARRDTLERCGYMSKLGGKVKTWKRRWFVLRDMEISYYKTQHDALRKPQGVITLDSSSRINRSHGELTFEVTNSKRTYYLTVENTQDMEKWIRSINNALKRQAASHLLESVDSKTVLKGWITKVKNGLTRKCFCILAGHHLIYYKANGDKTPIGQLNVQDSRIEEVDRGSESDEEFDSPPISQRHVISIWPQSHPPTYLIIPTKQEKDSWLYHLTVAAGGGTGNIGTEYEQILSKLMEFDGDSDSVFWKHPMVLHNKDPITRPLTTLPSENLQQMAIELFKNVQEFMNTMIESASIDLHVTLAQSILRTCLDHPQLQNELYCQLVKQTSRHPVQHKTSVPNLLLCGKHSWFLCDGATTSPTSSIIDLSESKLNPSPFVILQGWQLLSMCASLFLPKQCVLWLVRLHVQRSADHRTETGKYAIFCQRSLERTTIKGGRESPPSRMEVLSILLRNPYHHSLPISIPVHLLNDTYQVISFDGSTSVDEFLLSLNKVLGMRDCSQSGFALFTDDPHGHDTQHCLKSTLKVCDVIAMWEEAYRSAESGKLDFTRTIRLLYRNRLYFKSTCQEETDKERLLLVYQINKEIIHGRFPLNKDLALELASLMSQIELSDIRVSVESATPTAPPPHLQQALDKFYPHHYREDSSQDRLLISRLMERWQSLKGRSVNDCVRMYLTVTRKWPFCGATLYSVKTKSSPEKRVWLAVHEEGLSLLEHTSMQPITTYDYRSVVTFGGLLKDFMFVVNQLTESAPHHYEHHTDKLLFIMAKPQILEITHLIASYINFHLATSPDSSGDL